MKAKERVARKLHTARSTRSQTVETQHYRTGKAILLELKQRTFVSIDDSSNSATREGNENCEWRYKHSGLHTKSCSRSATYGSKSSPRFRITPENTLQHAYGDWVSGNGVRMEYERYIHMATGGNPSMHVERIVAEVFVRAVVSALFGGGLKRKRQVNASRRETRIPKAKQYLAEGKAIREGQQHQTHHTVTIGSSAAHARIA